MPLIEAVQLHKTFQIPKRTPGLLSSLRSLVHRQYVTKVAVREISFAIDEGEMVGYIGPNGAGKSTTIKMLTGILVPTSGGIDVCGIVPYLERRKNAEQIGVVFGQRSQLWWDLPVIDSFELLKRIYGVRDERYRENMDWFCEILGLQDFLNTPVRQLSLGQRMRADVAAALLHDPKILYLDEPTIGLDIVAKEKVRQFIRQMNREHGVTVILTTHDMTEIEKLCSRMILIDRGEVVYDGGIAQVKERFGHSWTLVVEFESEPKQGLDLPLAWGAVRGREGSKFWIGYDRRQVSTSDLISFLSTRYAVKDLTVEEPDIETILKELYTTGWRGEEVT